MGLTQSEPVLIVSPRYADDLAAMATAAGKVPRLERRPDAAPARFAAEPVRVVVVDARGALAAGLAVARALGPSVESRRGAMLVLLSRSDADASGAASEAGATSVLVSPFGSDSFTNALALAGRHAARLAAAAAAPLPSDVPGADRLTGLASGERIQCWLAEQRAAGQPAGVIAVGVGRFAQINTIHGRDVADRLLAAIARRLGPIADAALHSGEVRLLGRLTAAEFALGVAGAAAARGIEALACRLLSGFERPFAVDDRLIHVSGRAGIAWDDGSMDGKLKKLYFWELDYEILRTKNSYFSTSNYINSKQENIQDLSNTERRISTGAALSAALLEGLPRADGFTTAIGPFDPGSTPIFFSTLIFVNN